ncbi:MAG: hypothetical protein ABIF10_01780 [Candidatus Woesearchaeota archaeon]
MPKRSMLVTRPEHDTETDYLSWWAMEVIQEATKASFKVVDLRSDKATRKNLANYLSKKSFELILFNGHGDSRHICGHKDEVLIGCDDNESLLGKSIVHAVACDCAAEFGPSAIDKGVWAFIGYAGKFSFVTDKNRECVPEDDAIADIFKDAANEAPLGLVRGKSVSSAFEASQVMYRELIRKYSLSASVPESATIRYWLYWNKHFQRALGDLNATISFS